MTGSGPQALIVTGPGGAGKSTLAAAVAERLGWVLVGEDEHWIAHGWGAGMRTLEQEEVVQAAVADELRAALDAGRGVVLELILYRTPPNPLTAYLEVLAAHGAGCEVVVLRPPVAEIVRRMQERGRPSDLADLGRRRLDALWQLGVLEGDHIDPAWVVDPTDVPIPDLVDHCVRRLGQTDR